MPQLWEQPEFPFSYACSSGELVFGQVQCVLQGLSQNDHDGAGTVDSFKFRAAARAGEWIVSRINVRDPEDNEFLHLGYVVHHGSVDPTSYVELAAKSSGDNAEDPPSNITRVDGSYWSSKYGERAAINTALGVNRPYTVHQIKQLMGGRVIVLDASQHDSFVATIRNQYLDQTCYTLLTSPNAPPYGVHLSTPNESGKGETAWLCFSGEKHDTFISSDELLAIVYIPNDEGFSSLDPTQEVYVEHELAFRAGDVTADAMDSDAEYDPEKDEEAEQIASDSDDSDEEDGDGDLTMEDIDPNELKNLRASYDVPPPTISDAVYLHHGVIAIQGDYLATVDLVRINDHDAQKDIMSNQLIHATIPPGVSGIGNVEVYGSGGSDAIPFTSPVVATVTRATPARGTIWGGNSITIHGFHLDRTKALLFGTIPALEFEIISSTQIKAVSPAGPILSKSNVSEIITIVSDFDVSSPQSVGFTWGVKTAPVDTNYASALSTWQREVIAHPDDLDARLRLEHILERRGDSDAIIALWSEAAERGLRAGFTFDKLGKAYDAVGNVEGAIRAWKAAIEAGNDGEEVYKGLAGALAKSGDAEASAEVQKEMKRVLEN